MIDTRVNESLTLVASLLMIWLIPTAPLYAAVAVVGITLAVRWDAWYFGLLAIYAAGMVAVKTVSNPYDAYASEDLLLVLKAGITIMTVTWLIIKIMPGPVERAVSGVITIPVGAVRKVRWLSITAGVLGDIPRYRNGVPLFSDQVDIVRQFARQESNVVTGLLHEGWSVGLTLTLALVLVERRRPLPSEIAWLAAFTVGAFAGASRNSLLTAALPAILVGIHFRRRGSQAPRARQAVRGRRSLPLVSVIGAATLILGLMWFQSQRILDGRGAYESVFKRMYSGDPWGAILGSLDLSLSASFETLSRLVAYGSHGYGPLQFTVLQSLGAITRWAGYTPNLYGITSSLSAPYYMNTATYLAAPIIDFGITGALVASFLLGAIFGGIDRRLCSDPTVAGQLLRYYMVYTAIFSVYEFVPFINIAWLPFVVTMLVCRQRSLQGEVGVQADPARSRPGVGA